MKIKAIALACLIGLVPFAASAEEVGEIKLSTGMLSLSTKKIVVTAFDDPKVQGVTCHVSEVRIGGFTLQTEDPSNSSIACRQTGPISIAGATEEKPWGNLNVEGEDVFGASKGWFKSLRVTRIIDTTRKVLIYVVYTPKWGDDSNKNVISTVSLYGAK